MIYLAGPMSGIEDGNYPAFREAARVLRAQGYRIASPHEHGRPRHYGEAYYLRLGLLLLLEKCDSLALLPGWQTSKGTVVELTVARALKYKVYVIVDGNLLPYDGLSL